MSNSKDAENSMQTHLNYAEYMDDLSNNLSIIFKTHLKSACPSLRKQKKKILQKYTFTHYIHKTLQAEYEKLHENLDYSPFCSCWIAPKAYYLLFYQLCLIRTLLTSSEKISCDHSTLSKWMKSKIQENLKFNKSPFNEVYNYNYIQNMKFSPGFNLIRHKNLNKNELITRKYQILKKLLDELFKYKKFKSKEKSKTRNKVLKNTSISLFELFYWYRIKSNYRDISFLHDNDDYYVHKNYYYHYFWATTNFFKAYDCFIRKLYKMRFSEEIK